MDEARAIGDGEESIGIELQSAPANHASRPASVPPPPAQSPLNGEEADVPEIDLGLDDEEEDDLASMAERLVEEEEDPQPKSPPPRRRR
jgi:hypothetical protein